MLKVWKLTEFLDLSTDQGAKVFPVLQQYEAQFRAKAKEKEDIHRSLKEAIDAKTLTKDQVAEAMAKIQAVERDAMKIRSKMLQDLTAVLTPEQMAKFLLFESRFNDEIRDMIRDIRQENRPNRRMRRAGPPQATPDEKSTPEPPAD
jgi:hypothetical protein